MKPKEVSILSRNAAKKIWPQNLPISKPEDIAEILFKFENEPGSEIISGANSPKGGGEQMRKYEVMLAINPQLEEEELTSLNNLVEQYLIFAQGQAMRRIPMYMKDWIVKLNGFLTLNDRDILNNAGSISHELAKENAEREYNKFKETQQKMITESDFDKVIKKIETKKNK